ncbi:MAG: A24 family peptidase [Gammaproteobacteria bacterium]|nr:A24 family peptidase [Gammaproteobacteria bacterium]MDH5734738.1 A24 family peptidase [Gammaproteobacteria bacterium]
MTFIEALQQHDWLFYGLVIFVGLSVGSFLNVVIYRLPVMMENDWRQQCTEFLELEDTAKETKFSLATPASTCPKCGHKIRAWENIPVISYLLLKGKCASCKTSISAEYPLIETITAIASIIIANHYGVSLQTLSALFFTWALIALTMIDFHKQLLPDSIVFPLLWLGILISLFDTFVNLQTSVIGAMAGYLTLWSIYHLFKILTGKEGMGYGDFKLLAALGAWMGWKMLPLIIVMSSFVGAIIGITMIVFVRHDKNVPIPFGPFLAIAGWIALIWGESITSNWFYF